MILINILLVVLFLVAAFTVSYCFIFSVAGIFSFNKQYKSGDVYKKIAVFIPCSQQDAAVLHTAEQSLFQSYPSHRYDVIVIGDNLQKQTIDKLKKLPIKLVESHYDVSVKAKALNAAFQKLNDHYEIAVILDADNTMKSDFLEKINAAFLNGCYAIQGHKISRNDKTNVGILESISSEINNHIFRKGHQALHLSSAVFGSGIAFSYEYLKITVSEMEMINGFDKELELQLVEDNHRIAYLEDAIIIDENNQDVERFTHQRSSWLKNQFAYFKSHFVKGFLSVIFGKYDYANKIAHFALVPKAILLSFLLLMTGITALDINSLFPGFGFWLTLTIIYITSLIMAVPIRYYKFRTLTAIAYLPWSFILIIMDLFNPGNRQAAAVADMNNVQFEKQASEK